MVQGKYACSTARLAMAETQNEYSNGFDVDAYLTSRFADPRCQEDESLVRNFALQNIHDYFRKKSPVAVEGSTNFKVLDYGCGPVIANVISAAGFATEIVLAEYTEEGRTALRRWLDRDPSCFNWFPYFKYIVQTLEGKGLQEAGDREECVRRVVKAVVGCDVTQDPPIKKGYEGPYDVVICCFCLSTACRTKADCSNAVHRLATLVKPGGVLLLQTFESKNPDGPLRSYKIGSQVFHAVPLSQAFVLATLEQVGLSDITVKQLAADSIMDNRGLKKALMFAAHKK